MPLDAAAPVRGFRTCLACDGMGFFKMGPFHDRRYPKCPGCKGMGTIDLPEPAPPVPY